MQAAVVEQASFGALARTRVSRAGAYTEVGWRPGQEICWASPCSDLRSFGSKFMY